MDIALLIRSLGGLLAVLALLSGALWLVRRYDLRLPGRIGGGREARLAIAERVTIDAKRSLLVVRHNDTEHLLLIAPEGPMHLSHEECIAPEELALSLRQCRELGRERGDAVPMPPAPPPHLPIPAFPIHRRKPRHDPLPLTRQ